MPRQSDPLLEKMKKVRPAVEKGKKVVKAVKAKKPAKEVFRTMGEGVDMKPTEAKLWKAIRAKVPERAVNVLSRGWEQYQRSCVKPVESQNFLEKRVCAKMNALANQYPEVRKLIEYTLRQLQKKSK